MLVGWTGFEPATTCTPCKCATGLRHHPILFRWPHNELFHCKCPAICGTTTRTSAGIWEGKCKAEFGNFKIKNKALSSPLNEATH